MRNSSSIGGFIVAAVLSVVLAIATLTAVPNIHDALVALATSITAIYPSFGGFWTDWIIPIATLTLPFMVGLYFLYSLTNKWGNR